MTRPPSWILCRVSSRRSLSATRRIWIWFRHTSVRPRRSSFAVCVFAAKGCAGGAPPHEALVTGLGEGVLQFEQSAGEGVVIGFKNAEPFGEAADFGAAFFEQFGLFVFEALLFLLECLEACSVIRRFFHARISSLCVSAFFRPWGGAVRTDEPPASLELPQEHWQGNGAEKSRSGAKCA